MPDKASVAIDHSASPLLLALTAALEKAKNEPIFFDSLSVRTALETSSLWPQHKALIRLNELGQEINPFLTYDKRLPNEVMYLRRDRGCSPLGRTIGMALIRVALILDSADAAIEWLAKILGMGEARGIVICPLFGVSIARDIVLMDGLEIVAIEHLPDSPQKRSLQERSDLLNFSVIPTALQFTPPTCALTLKKTVRPVFLPRADLGNFSTEDQSDDDNLLLNDIILILTLVGPRPSISVEHWFSFEDVELAHIDAFNNYRYLQMLEILPPYEIDTGELDPVEAAFIVGKYFQLAKKDQETIKKTLSRLSRAIRRHSAGDKAVELAIAFEILLKDGGNTEISHKVKVRTARMLDGGLSEISCLGHNMSPRSEYAPQTENKSGSLAGDSR